MSTVADILARIQAVFAKGQLNSAVMAGVTADLTQAVEELNDGLGAGAVPATRLLLATAPVRISGAASADLSADRTISVQLASQTEVDTGTDAVKLVTPSTLAAAKTVAQPPSYNFSGGLALSSAHIGAVGHATGAGAQAVTLPDLSAALQSGRELILTIQCEGAATAVTITPGGTSQIDGAGVGVAFVATVGRTRISLTSRDGLNWFSGKSA